MCRHGSELSVYIAAQVDSELPQMVLSSCDVIVYVCASLAQKGQNAITYVNEFSFSTQK